MDLMNNCIFLVGYRGVGKTTVGRELAKTLGYTFFDTDEKIVQQQEVTIAELVATKGWDNFRGLESDVLASLKDERALVVATGGGAVMHQEQWQQLRKKGVVFWLAATKEVLQGRLSGACSKKQRPSLTGVSHDDEIELILKERNPLYRQTAHHRIDTDSKSSAEIVSEIKDILRDSATDR